MPWLASVMAFASASAGGQPLFVEDFQDGDANGWRAGGDGAVEISSYRGNYSLRLTKRATAMISLGVEGPPEVIVSVAFAAFDLEGRDACIAEASSDNGATWTEINRVEDGADDGFTLYAGSEKVGTPASGVPLILRLRIDANGDNDTCWADNIQIAAAARRSSTAPANAKRFVSSAFLLGTEGLSDPVAMRAFSPSEEAVSPSARFEGMLRVRVARQESNLRVLRDNFDFVAKLSPDVARPPDFDMAFVQSGDALIPKERGLIRTESAAWDIMIEPGEVWSEPGDGGYARASIPFALQERNANCTHNGVLTFLFDEDGNTSRAAFQIASETCFYFQYDMWGVAVVEYEPGNVAGAEILVAAYEAERAGRLPVRPFSVLGEAYPKIDVSAFAAPSDVSPEHLTTFGVIVDGVHYRGDCPTRLGPYPFCESMALPSYSTAKSVFAGLGLMRLELLYPGSVDKKVSAHVPQCRGKGWGEVTFGQTLDMATGRYKSSEPDADENEAVLDGFFIDTSHEDKIRRACAIYPKRTDPGKEWVYHTTDHYILGTAMQDLLRREAGEGADIYADLLVEPIWKRIGLSPVTFKTRRTRDDVGQPFVGWGLTFLADDIAKLASFIAIDDGMVNGEALVDRALLAASLQERHDDRGLPAPNEDFLYNNGFWAWDAAEALGCNAPVWTPFMSGYGGIAVVLMPNDLIFYYVSDNAEFSWARAVRAANEQKAMCGGDG